MAEPEQKKDFFVSRNKADSAWAKWIAWQLEEAGYTSVLQDWDFRPSQNFILRMQEAATSSQRTIAVLSPDYLAAEFTQPEWAAAFVQDPQGAKGTLLTVRVQECEQPGLLRAVIYIDLVGLDEAVAKDALLEGVKQGRVKPATPPGFPGGAERSVPERPRFPGALPRICNIPHLRNPNFTGREDLLAKLREQLASRKAAALTAIHGMGGVGKTQLATEYAYWHLGGYEAIWWVRSEEPARLASDYAGLGIALGVTSAQEPSQEVQISATRSWLEQQAGWLVVFDNVEKPDDLNDYLPRGGGGHVLITSRHQSWGGIAAQVSVEEWHRPESIAFLLKRTGREDREGANGVAEALGDLPLALAQAGAYMEEAHLPFVDYVHLLEINQKELLSKGTAFTGYELTVATAWSASFEKLETANPAAADLLRLCAFFAPDDIPLDVISKGAQYLPGPLAKAMSDQMNRAECVAALGRYSLAEVTGDALSVHRLVQAVMRDRLPDDPSKTWVEAAVGLINQAFPSQVERNPSAWPVCWRLLPHALASAGQAEALQLAPQATARLLNQTAGYLRERAQFAEAKVALERALGISEAAYGPDHPEVATAVNNLGNVLWDLGDLAGARAAFERALRIDEAAYGPDDPEVATDVNNLGNVLQGLGELAGARAAFERALRIDEAAYGPDHPEVAIDVNNLGSVLRALGELAGARAALERALRINEAVYGPDHPAVATDVNNLGNVLQGLGELAGARAAFERALEILRRFLGDDHPKTVIVRKNLESLDK